MKISTFSTLILFPLLFLVSFETEASSFSIENLLPAYASLQESLASDNLDVAKNKAKDLQAQIANTKGKEVEGLKTSIQKFIKASSLKEARKEFKDLSDPFVKWVSSHKASQFEVVYCPMAGAKWVQKKGEITNPYFGSEMLHCGEKAS